MVIWRKGFGAVYLPYALECKYPTAVKDWIWQYVFSASGSVVRPFVRCDQLTTELAPARVRPCWPHKKKATDHVYNQWLNDLVAGAGFEPTTFGL